jgi:hypothetical protein
VIIEVFGPSCAGKTSLIQGVVETLGRDGIPVEMYSGKAVQPIQNARADLIRRPSDLRFSIWCAANPAVADSPSGRQFSQSLVLSRRLKGLGVVQILDEGPLKWSSTIGQGSKFPNALASCIRRPAVAVLVDCDFDVRVARLRSTGRFHARGRTEVELKARDHAKREWNEWLVERLKLNVIRVDTSSGEDRSERVAQTVQARFIGEAVTERWGFPGGIAE